MQFQFKCKLFAIFFLKGVIFSPGARRPLPPRGGGDTRDAAQYT